MSSVIDGKQFADDLCEKLKAEVTELEAQHQLLPCISAVSYTHLTLPTILLV